MDLGDAPSRTSVVVAVWDRISTSVVVAVWDRITVGALCIFTLFFSLCSFFCHIQTFFYTIINIFITFLENVNKSHTPVLTMSL
jgi:hypothetical protein